MVKTKKQPAPLSRSSTTMSLGNFIKKWREFRGIATQGELAKKAELTRATVSRLESGAMTYRQWQLERIAQALECEPGDLLSTDPEKVGSIFQIYSSLTQEQKVQAVQVLQAIATKPRRVKR